MYKLYHAASQSASFLIWASKQSHVPYFTSWKGLTPSLGRLAVLIKTPAFITYLDTVSSKNNLVRLWKQAQLFCGTDCESNLHLKEIKRDSGEQPDIFYSNLDMLWLTFVTKIKYTLNGPALFPVRLAGIRFDSLFPSELP